MKRQHSLVGKSWRARGNRTGGAWCGEARARQGTRPEHGIGGSQCTGRMRGGSLGCGCVCSQARLWRGRRNRVAESGHRVRSGGRTPITQQLATCTWAALLPRSTGCKRPWCTPGTACQIVCCTSCTGCRPGTQKHHLHGNGAKVARASVHLRPKQQRAAHEHCMQRFPLPTL